ncbi:MAG: DUF1127 domain-containing protein [Deltaproteobacteria bacterium]
MTYLSESALSDSATYRSRKSIFGTLLRALSVRRERKALVQLDARLLHDIGLDREIAISEAKRKLWDVPNHWCV